MKKPFWGEYRASACRCLVCIVALCVAQQLHADDGVVSPTFGPDVTPLSRAISGPANTLNYQEPASAPFDWGAPRGAVVATPTVSTAWPTTSPGQAANNPGTSTTPVLKFPFSSSAGTGATPSATTLPSTPGMPTTYTAPPNAASTPNTYTAAQNAANLPNTYTAPGVIGLPTVTPTALPSGTSASPRPIDVFSQPAMTNPPQALPSNNFPGGPSPATPGIAPAAAAPANATPAKPSPWRPIQAAFRELSNSKSDASGPPPAAEIVDPQVSTQSPSVMASPAPVVMTPRIAYVRADAVPTTPAELSNSTPEGNSSGSMPTITDSPPPDVTYSNPSGCGCGGGYSPDGSNSCRTCGGWQPGTCSTHDPNGSCFLQRLACCLCKPYPDCSNGCVDFCHSWIFHEDDCWIFSNHKCCNAGCGPYPYGTCATDGQGQGSGCGCNCGCGPCVPPPDWYFTAGALVLTRDNEARNQTVVENTTTSTTALGTGDFDFAWITGPSFVLGYRPTKMDAWELSYFGLYDWNSAQTATGAANLSLPGDLGTTGFFNGASLVHVNYNSQVDDAELNYFWHHGCPDFMWMVGFRYFHLDEKFDITSTVTGSGSSAYDISTDNDLAGGQIGARWRHCCNWFEWDVTAKAGAFGNSVGQEQVVTDATVIRDTDTGHHTGVWAFVGDLGSNVGIRLCPNWTLMGGYNVMWVDGVALAPDQLDFTDTTSSGTGLDKGGHVFYQGAHVGLGCRW